MYITLDKGGFNMCEIDEKNDEDLEVKKSKNENSNENKRITNPQALVAALLLCTSFVAGFVGGGSAIKCLNQLNSGASTSSDQSESSMFSVSDIAEKNINSIAEISTEIIKTDKTQQQYITSGAGSGIVVSTDGYILTNYHVVSGAKTITAKIDSENYSAELVGSNEQLDVALVKIEKTDLVPVDFGKSDDVKVGDDTVVIGNPFGQLGGTVTKGIISALDREITINNETMNLIQTDAAINPGNSGGGLFNMKGELIGMVIAKASSSTTEGIGFAIKVDDLKTTLENLKQSSSTTEEIDIEISVTDVSILKSSSIYQNYTKGVFVTEVPENSNWETAGIKVGDCIVAINGKEIENTEEFESTLKNYSAGESITLTILRGSDTLELTLELAKKSC